MVIEIRRVQFVNKGAELMLLAILDKIGSALDDVTFTIAPDLGLRPYDKLAALGIRPKAWLWRYRIQWGYLADIIPQKLLEMYGVVTDSQVDVVLDASGFAYGDQWGPAKTARMARATRRWRSQGTKVILLPQAFGPFTNARIRDSFKTIVQSANRVYARDPASLKHVTECAGPAAHIRHCPDFTVLIPGRAPNLSNIPTWNAAIIPNYKMIDKTSMATSSAYLPFIVRCLQSLTDSGYEPFFLIHAGRRDEDLAHRAGDAFGRDVPIVIEDDPVRTKGIIGACKAVVSSRYHGLVSALSQGIPAIGTGWSHKYAALFDRYDCPSLLLLPTSSEDLIQAAIGQIDDRRDEIVTRLRTRAKEHSEEVDRMWDDVLQVITE